MRVVVDTNVLVSALILKVFLFSRRLISCRYWRTRVNADPIWNWKPSTKPTPARDRSATATPASYACGGRAGHWSPAAPTDKKATRQAVDFVIDLCTYPGPRDTTAEARRHILEAPARCLSAEWVRAGLAPAQAPTTVEDIEAGRPPGVWSLIKRPHSN